MTRASSNGGMTLIEVVIAMGVFAITLTALLSALSTTMILDSVSRERTQALNEAMTKMEDALALTFDDLALVEGLAPTHVDRAFDVDIELNASTAKLKPGAGLTKPGLVTVSSFGGNTNMLLVDVSVTWKSDVDQDMVVSLKSLKARTAP